MLELSVAVDDPIESANVCITWRVTTDTLEMLAAQGCKEPMLLLISTAKGERARFCEYRKIVPLGEKMTYIDCRSAGENQLFGIVLFDDSPDRLRSRYLSRDRYRYATDVLTYDGSGFNTFTGPCERLTTKGKELTTTSIGVTIPEGCFAKKPPEWLRTWVNRWHGGQEAHDSCEFYMRCGWAFSIQPFAVLFLKILLGVFGYVFAWVAGIFCFLFGLEGFELKTIFWPWPAYKSHNFVFDDLKAGLLFWMQPEHGTKWPRPWFPLMPAFPLATCLVLMFGFKMKFKAAIWLAGCGSLAAALISTIVFGVIVACIAIIKAIRKRPAKASKKHRAERPAPAYLSDTLLQSSVHPMRIADLPPSHRTFRLWREAKKAGSCRPYSG